MTSNMTSQLAFGHDKSDKIGQRIFYKKALFWGVGEVRDEGWPVARPTLLHPYQLPATQQLSIVLYFVKIEAGRNALQPDYAPAEADEVYAEKGYI